MLPACPFAPVWEYARFGRSGLQAWTLSPRPAYPTSCFALGMRVMSPIAARRMRAYSSHSGVLAATEYATNNGTPGIQINLASWGEQVQRLHLLDRLHGCMVVLAIDGN